MSGESLLNMFCQSVPGLLNTIKCLLGLLFTASILIPQIPYLLPINKQIPKNKIFIGTPTFSILVQLSFPGDPWKYAKMITEGNIPINAKKCQGGEVCWELVFIYKILNK